MHNYCGLGCRDTDGAGGAQTPDPTWLDQCGRAGCSATCFVDPVTGRVFDFCGQGCARLAGALGAGAQHSGGASSEAEIFSLISALRDEVASLRAGASARGDGDDAILYDLMASQIYELRELALKSLATAAGGAPLAPKATPRPPTVTPKPPPNQNVGPPKPKDK